MYFMSLAVYHLFMDVWQGEVSWFTLLIDLILLVPIIFRRGSVLLFFGIVFTLFWGYFLFIATVLYFKAAYHPVNRDYLGVGLFMIFSFLCSVTMAVGGGMKLHDEFHPKQTLIN